MPEIMVEFPHIIATENLQPRGTFNLRTQPSLVQKILKQSYNGVVTKDGQWARNKDGELKPDNDWKIEKLDVGRYKVSHRMGYNNLSLSVSLLRTPGSINTIENHPEYFIVESTLDGTPTDMPFIFSLVRVISAPSR